MCFYKTWSVTFYDKNKKSIDHIAHLRKQFKYINTYDYIITLIKRRKNLVISHWKKEGPFIWSNLNLLNPKVLCAKFSWNGYSGSGEEDENVKSLRQRRQRTRDIFWSEKFTRATMTQWVRAFASFMAVWVFESQRWQT